jgi:hypothetical protein
MIEITNIWDQLCNICIVIMKALSRETGMSYGLINILLFVKLGPISTICFMLTTAFQVWMKKQPLKKNPNMDFCCYRSSFCLYSFRPRGIRLPALIEHIGSRQMLTVVIPSSGWIVPPLYFNSI